MQAWTVDEMRLDDTGNDMLDVVCKQVERQRLADDHLMMSVNPGIVGGFAFLQRYYALSGKRPAVFTEGEIHADALERASKAWTEMMEGYRSEALSAARQVAYSYACSWALKYLRQHCLSLEQLLQNYYLYEDRRTDEGTDWLIDICHKVRALGDEKPLNPLNVEAGAFLSRAIELGFSV